MPKQFITLPNDKRVTLSQYVAAWKRLKDAPTEQEFAGFCHWPERAEYILAEMRNGLEDRINLRGKLVVREPRDTTIALTRDQGNIHARLTSRVALHYLESKTCQARFGHLID